MKDRPSRIGVHIAWLSCTPEERTWRHRELAHGAWLWRTLLAIATLARGLP